jgi:hypothetical protein
MSGSSLPLKERAVAAIKCGLQVGVTQSCVSSITTGDFTSCGSHVAFSGSIRHAAVAVRVAACESEGQDGVTPDRVRPRL